MVQLLTGFDNNDSYWILFPITIVMVCLPVPCHFPLLHEPDTKPQILTGVLRHYATVLMASAPKKQDQKTTREQRALLHGINVRGNYHVLSKPSFTARRDALIAAYESGAYLKDPDNRGQPPPNPLSDPNAMEGMMGMMKNQMAMIIPNSLIMGWINAFFSGYVISACTFLVPP